MNLDLPRFAFTPSETQGNIRIDNWSCFTIERPWLRWDYPGGQPFESCIPDGTYDLVPFIRLHSGARSFAIVNPDLGVYFNDADRPIDDQGQRHGRYLCLIHIGNYVNDVVGCIAPGKARTIDRLKNRLMVTSSAVTMTEILSRVGWESGHTLRIFQAPGAVDTPLVTL